MSTLAKFTKQGLWSGSIAVTVVLFALFLYLQRQESKLLELDTKWVVVALIPLIVAILKSNIIQRFQGFGFELETRLEDPIGRISVVATDALVSIPEDEKASLEHLYSLDHAKREETRRLTLVQGRGSHYNEYAMRQYLEELPNLEHLEVRDENGQFVALLPIGLFRNQDSVDMRQVDKLLRAIENRSVSDDFGTSAITKSVRDEESLLTLLPKLRESRFGLLPVTSSNGQLLGIVTTEIVEKRIADAVIAAQKNA
jgi:hypothetical protein